jgi:hypothetical protein
MGLDIVTPRHVRGWLEEPARSAIQPHENSGVHIRTMMRRWTPDVRNVTYGPGRDTLNQALVGM